MRLNQVSSFMCSLTALLFDYVLNTHIQEDDLREVAINCPEGWRNVRSTRGVVVSVVNKPNVKHPVLCKLHILPESDVQKYEKFCFIFSVAEFSMNSVQLFIEGSALEQFGFESVPELGTEYCIALAPSFDYISIEVSPGEDRYASPANVTNYQHSFMFKYRFIEKVKSTNVGSTKEEKDDGYSKNTLFVFFSAPVALLLILYLAFCTRKKRPRTLSNAGLAKDFPPGPYYTADPFDLHGRKLGSIRLQRAVELLENTTTAEIAIAQSSGMLPTPSPQDDELTQVTRVSAEVTPQTPVRASNSLQNEQNTMNKEDIPLASSLGAQSSLATSETLKDCTDRTEEQPSVDTNVVEDEKFPLTDSASCRPPPPGYNSLFSKHEQ
ncbi:uncharacterized protein LOC101853525 isoform X2 [Aplysia californica]|uniref:Uncharacterized protein LOC101853525 isoform X2 n=1 Tax=Aplysia californica TaxID=6500 RepID=A0ABM1W5A3_APLCA|nr:uncharacterized protein LOC101853525 isoform X2 [Aplysia californica]